ncbi:Mov34/MPN/PAD-1 family protein [Rhizobium sp. XQZ8]|uniref:Mov34/MPN/PAD-1 family protein n=1 Tax=Rhizobium populisoli TaxID=2859785 RepID=UPI001CA50964|nr:Mov34/MPN/PAD-1 family protein [Rhizobium populisoli]MBW6426066.1 Mov34/MPN/PAD-1 family protein [Rhizobium populisoli]
MPNEAEELRSRLARSVVRYITTSVDHPYCSLLSAHRDGVADVVDIEVEPELAQDRRVAILPQEPIRLLFFTEDDSIEPSVRSLREDFPLGQVHTSLDRSADGLGLCIWEEGWPDLSSTLTGQMLIERIRAWFTLMASGKLHGDDQPLEPLIPMTSHTLVIPPGAIRGPWHIEKSFKDAGTYTLLMSDTAPELGVVDTGFAIFHRELPHQVHRALGRRPYDLGALQTLLETFSIDLVADLRQWLAQGDQTVRAHERHLLLIFAIPMRRAEDGPDEALEVWAYTGGETLAVFGETLGATFTVVQEGGSITTPALLSARPLTDLTLIPMPGWRVVQRLDRATARVYAGRGDAPDLKLVGIGAGAIGSNVVMNTVRAGIGEWTIIDDDDVLPHNTVRQIQTNPWVGYPKALVLAAESNQVLAQSGVTGIVENLLRPGDKKDQIASAMKEADLTVDFSASPAVVGHLAESDLTRAASLFFSPDGSDLVLLAEDRKRALRIDEIEAQYFLKVATDRRLDGHLAAARLDRIRYANACQDLSRPLPPWRVQMLSGLGSGKLIELLAKDAAIANIWRLDSVSGGVIPVPLRLHGVQRFEAGQIKITVSGHVLDTVRTLRGKCSPNETGGVLLGTYDVVRGVVHALAALPAPSDSRQAPTYFIRGVKDLQPLVEQLAKSTAGRLKYIGEWHSHPQHVAARPSSDDEKVFGHLSSHLEPTGSPFAMMITGAEETWFRIGWAERGQLEGVLSHGAG